MGKGSAPKRTRDQYASNWASERVASQRTNIVQTKNDQRRRLERRAAAAANAECWSAERFVRRRRCTKCTEDDDNAVSVVDQRQNGALPVSNVEWCSMLTAHEVTTVDCTGHSVEHTNYRPPPITRPPEQSAVALPPARHRPPFRHPPTYPVTTASIEHA